MITSFLHCVLGIVTKVHLLHIMYQEVFSYYTDTFWTGPTFYLCYQSFSRNPAVESTHICYKYSDIEGY
jgi:hypothetical protein